MEILNLKQFICLIFLSFATGIYAQNEEQSVLLNEGGTKSENYYEEIPYEEITGKIIINIPFNGKSRRFLLDTGAPTTISKSLYKELNVGAIGNKIAIDVSGLEGSMQVVTLPEIQIGKIVFNDIPSLVSPEVELFTCYNLDGVIGSNLLRNSIVHFDSKKKVIILTDDDSRFDGISTELFLDSAQSSPHIKLYLENDARKMRVGESNVLFDTGDRVFYTHSIHIYKKILEAGLDGLFEKIGEGNGISSGIGLHGLAEDQDHYLLKLPGLIINGMAFTNLTVETTHSESSRIGTELLKYTKVTLDYKNKKIYLNPYGIDMTAPQWGIAPSFKNDKLIVGMIWDSSLKDQINVGDEILKFGNIDCRNLKICDAITSDEIFYQDKDHVILLVKDINTGKKKSIEIYRK